MPAWGGISGAVSFPRPRTSGAGTAFAGRCATHTARGAAAAVGTAAISAAIASAETASMVSAVGAAAVEATTTAVHTPSAAMAAAMLRKSWS